MKKIIFTITLCISFFCFLSMHVSADSDTVTVSNKAELKKALSNNTLNIQLSNDIHYGDSDSFYIQSNVNIFGNGHSMLDDGSSQANFTAGFYLQKANLKVSYNDLVFGDSTHIQTWGGNLQNALQVDLTINNVNYVGSSAAQPFYLSNNSTVTFIGKNYFSSSIGSGSGQEFMEGGQMIFAENSVTQIDHYTSTATLSFYWPKKTGSIDIRKNAQVKINTNKYYLVYGSNLNISLDEGASLLLNNSMYGMTMTNGYKTSISMLDRSYFQAVGNGSFGDQYRNVVNFTTKNPAGIDFKNTKKTGVFYNDVTLNSGGIYPYSFKYDNNGIPKIMAAPFKTWTLNNGLFGSNGSEVNYRPDVTFLGNVNSNVQNNPIVSEINFSDLGITGPCTYKGTDYKIYNQSLVSNVDSEKSQSTISNDKTSVYNGYVNNDSATINEVPAGDYVIYLRSSGQTGSGIVYSNWVEKKVTVKKTLLNITVPIETAFAIFDNSPFVSNDQYQIINNSNFPTSYHIGSVRSQGAAISLVERISSETPNNSLYLAIKDTLNNILNFVTKAGGISVSAFGGKSIFNIVGQYKGPISYSHVDSFGYIINLVFQ
ncbi:hypothetical protein [Fructobacillus durionis]|uniref:hypothetical protein n=1 Tax=Fructobacillus durionis TaxID=283737 RepID=UPI0036121D9F